MRWREAVLYCTYIRKKQFAVEMRLLRLRSALRTLLELMRSVLSMNRGYAFDLYDLRRDPSQREGWESDTVIYHRGETCIDLPMKMEEAASVLRRYQRARGQVEVIDHNQPLSC
jgi:hypothetical protein